MQAYDGSGNLLDDGSGRSYTYDAENRLTRITNGTTLDMEYRYDAMGRRSHAINYITGTETIFRHAGQMEIEELEVSRDCAGGAVQCPGDRDAKITSVTATHRNIIGAGVDERLAWHIRDSDTLYFPMVNHQGSTMMLVDVDGELVTSQGDNGVFLYDEYGNTKASVALTGYPYRFTGRRLDPETALYYYRARYYDSAKGRFLQTDPIGYEDQMNLYAYVHNNPLMFTDPSGEFAITFGGDVEGSAAGLGGGAQAKLGLSLTKDPNTGAWKFQLGPIYSIQNSVLGLNAREGKNMSGLERLKSFVASAILDTGAAGMAEVGIYWGNSENPADVEDLGGESAQIGGTLSKKILTRRLWKPLGKVLNWLPAPEISLEGVVGENGIKGIEIGAGGGIGNPILGGDIGTTTDAVISKNSIWYEKTWIDEINE